MGLRLGLSLWGSTVGHPSNCWASCSSSSPHVLNITALTGKIRQNVAVLLRAVWPANARRRRTPLVVCVLRLPSCSACGTRRERKNIHKLCLCVAHMQSTCLLWKKTFSSPDVDILLGSYTSPRLSSAVCLLSVCLSRVRSPKLREKRAKFRRP